MEITIRSKGQLAQPPASPSGETVYELIGRSFPKNIQANHSLAHIEISPGGGSLPHYHLVCQETYYMLSGSALLQVDGQEIRLLPGQSVLITPGQVHQISNPGEDIAAFLAVCVPAWFPEDSVYV